MLIFGVGLHVILVGPNHSKAKRQWLPESNFFGLFYLKVSASLFLSLALILLNIKVLTEHRVCFSFFHRGCRWSQLPKQSIELGMLQL